MVRRGHYRTQKRRWQFYPGKIRIGSKQNSRMLRCRRRPEHQAFFIRHRQCQSMQERLAIRSYPRDLFRIDWLERRISPRWIIGVKLEPSYRYSLVICD